jgi:hypothetical protein
MGLEESTVSNLKFLHLIGFSGSGGLFGAFQLLKNTPYIDSLLLKMEIFLTMKLRGLSNEMERVLATNSYGLLKQNIFII